MLYCANALQKSSIPLVGQTFALNSIPELGQQKILDPIEYVVLAVLEEKFKQ